MNSMKIINSQKFIKALATCNNGQFGQLSNNDFELVFEKIEPIKGYEKPINTETGEKFPNCCEWHKSIYNITLKWFDDFPNCCDNHKKLLSQSWYNKSNYEEVINKIVNQLSYTEHCIEENINKQDWYYAITDYIQWNYSSFGQLPNGFGSPVGLDKYLNVLKQFIENTTNEIPKDKRQQLIEFIDNYYNPTETVKTDLNVLYSTYKKWIKIFPFEISFFTHLKPQFEKQLPFIKGKPEVNRYTGIAKVRMHTKSSLIDALLKLTNSLITQINSHSLYKKGLLTEPQKIKLELVLNERKLKLKQGYVNNSENEETRYRKILKEWFADEKEFINEITPLLENVPPQPIKTIFKFDNNFDTVNTENIFNHFKTGLFESKMLTEKELESYLKAAFENKQKPKILLSIKNAVSKDKVMKVFYEYYKDIAGKPHGKQKEYAGLLGNYFQGYKTSTVSSNFSKTIY